MESGRKERLLGLLRVAAQRGEPSPEEARDLSGLNLVGEDLRGLDLTDCDLSGCDLSGADLTGVHLTRAVLEGATLHKTVLAHAELLGARLARADLSECQGEGAGFGHAVLHEARLFHARFDKAIFSGADLAGADLRRADLSRSRMRGADLRGALLEGALLADVDLTGARVRGARFSNAILRRSQVRDLEGYIEAEWIGADFRDIDFTGAYRIRRFILDQNYLHEFRRESAGHRVLYLLWLVTSDCGRSLLRWSLFVSAIAVLFGFLYTRVELDYGGRETPLSPWYFSVVTLTTLGYGDVVPVSLGAQALAMIEVTVGYVGLGGLLSILANKMGRRGE